MPDILHEVTIAATPDKVYEALTEQQGLARWWSIHAITQPQVGSIAEFSFPSGFGIQMEITELEPGRKVYWAVKGGLPDWTGTRVTWDLTAVDKATKVRFGHRDFASAEGSLAGASYSWAWYLTSLKSYMEMGKGRPGQAPV